MFQMFKKRQTWSCSGRKHESAKSFNSCQGQYEPKKVNVLVDGSQSPKPPKKPPEPPVTTIPSIPSIPQVCPLLEILNDDDRSYLRIRVFNESILALLDSGSNVSILGSPSLFLLKRLNLPINYDVSFHLTTADGTLQSTLGYVDLPIGLDNLSKNFRVLVVPSISQPMILGMDVIQAFNIKLDFTNFSFNTSTLSTAAVHAIKPAEDLTPLHQDGLNEVVKLFRSIGPENEIGRTHLLTHTIKTEGSPIRQRQYPLSPAMQSVLNKEIDEMLKLDIIKPVTTTSPWLSPL
ncbi:uncharacterized protein LOC123681193 [Harmonia axyridis]|uniref:uncharacterized protein LOC123681193 n=1 Tax=Harmonia axyridis TaxID=115357 RepID=UPI001E2797A3|nr:uncharacterized protein LOC123681193 [Harmonia axyridis]